MSFPCTPKKADEGISVIVRDLSAKWSLQIPPRSELYSPARDSRPERVEDQVYSRIRYLYYQNRDALNYAIGKFEKYAPMVFSQWQFKPHGDLEVLPIRSTHDSALRRDSSLRRSEITDDAAAELTRSLLRFLDDVAARVKSNVDYKDPNEPQEIAPKQVGTSPQRPKSARPFRRQTSLSRFFAPRKDDSPARVTSLTSSHPSSDEFAPDRETSIALEDIIMKDAPTVSPPVTPSKVRADSFGITMPPPDSVDEEYQTPPTSPLLSKSGDVRSDIPVSLESSENPKDDTYFRRKYDPVWLPRPWLPGKKRPPPDPIKPLGSRKISRDGKSNNVPSHYNVNYMSPITVSISNEVDKRGLHVPVVNDKTPFPPTQDLARSFDSIMSATTSMTSTSKAWRSPNISFTTDSAMTSFTSSTDGSDLTEASTIKQPVPENDRHRYFRRSKSENCRTEYSESDRNMAPPAYAVQESTEQYLAAHLFRESPFASSSAPGDRFVSFRQFYEVTRVSFHCKLPMSDFFDCLSGTTDNYEDLWSSLGSIAKLQGKSLPDRSSLIAWSKAGEGFESVALSGDLKFSERKGNPLFEFYLKPLKMESSYRLSRKFGSDRFCVISTPGIDSDDLPLYLKHNSNPAREMIIKWLIDTKHCFLGRSWRVFYVKPESSTKKTKRKNQASFNEVKYRIFFFAEDGSDFRKEGQVGELDPRKPNHSPMEVKSLIDWFMPAWENKKEWSLKFFARLSLGLTSTTPTIEFKPMEVIRSDDARANSPAVRKLDLTRSEEKKGKIKPRTPKTPVINDEYRIMKDKSPVMNDGCARISKAAALGVTEMLNLSQAPCAFQGRIGGAKGVWMVDPLGERLPQHSRGYWIEITDSQLKFEGHPADKVFPDPARLTFEVHSWAKKLIPASLNFQLIPILLNRGVPREVFVTLLEENLTDKAEKLEVAMDSGIALRRWNQDNYPVSEERARNKGIKMMGGLPDSPTERINWFVEHGFEPRHCSFLKTLLFKTIKGYCSRLEDRMNISVGKSTQALMIADPLAVLEEDEVHIGFSNLFHDPKSRWAETMIHDVDVLVARLPALLPSDIQRVHAVFKPELRMYRDVIVFSSKGPSSLADKLSGGDFDGDKAWICWEPTIVTPFENSPVPDAPSLETYGIRKDTRRIGDIIDDPDYTSKFLKHAFNFNLQNNLLGSCTEYHKALCYINNSIDQPSAIAIAFLLGHLVDRPKGGLIFDEKKWTTYLRRNKLPSWLPKPAYKDRDRARPTKHVLDHLVFDVAKGVRQTVLHRFSLRFKDVATWDERLVRVWKEESGQAQGDKELLEVLTNVKVDLKPIVDFWRSNAPIDGDDDEGRALKKPNAMSFKAVVEKCREDFLKLKPPGETQHPVVKRWYQEWKATNGGGYWSLIKASALFSEHHRSNLVWWIAGVELGEMKVMAEGRGSYRLVIGEIFNAFKLDGKAADRARRVAENEGAAEADDDEDDEFGDLDWGSQWG